MTSSKPLSRSERVYRGLKELTYPFHDGTFTVTTKSLLARRDARLHEGRKGRESTIDQHDDRSGGHRQGQLDKN